MELNQNFNESKLKILKTRMDLFRHIDNISKKYALN